MIRAAPTCKVFEKNSLSYWNAPHIYMNIPSKKDKKKTLVFKE
jgi:hypothetical protein